MSVTNNTPKLDVKALAATLAQSPELKAALLAELGVKAQEAFTPTWHVDDKGMVILEFSGNPWSAANPYMSGRVAVRFLGPDHRIGKEILAAVGKEVVTKYRVPVLGQKTSNGKQKYIDATGKTVFTLDPPAAPKEDRVSKTEGTGSVLSEAEKAEIKKALGLA
jgi:hypothetical protein